MTRTDINPMLVPGYISSIKARSTNLAIATCPVTSSAERATKACGAVKVIDKADFMRMARRREEAELC